MLKYVTAEENAQGAAIRARYYNDSYKHTYTPKQQAQAQTFCDILKLAYSGDVYVNYRKQFIAVKLAKNAYKRDKHFARELELLVAERKYKIAITAQGTIYRIARA